MNFEEACDRAEFESLRDSCTKHVNGRVKLLEFGPGMYEPYLDGDGWTASDWYAAGSTVLTFHNGNLREAT